MIEYISEWGRVWHHCSITILAIVLVHFDFAICVFYHSATPLTGREAIQYQYHLRKMHSAPAKIILSGQTHD